MNQQPAKTAPASQLAVGFILLPHFTLLPFAAFIDALRLAADEGDQSRQINCQWTVMGETTTEVDASCGVSVRPWEEFRDPGEFDYIVVVGGLLHQGPTVSRKLVAYLQEAASRHVIQQSKQRLFRSTIIQNECLGNGVEISWRRFRNVLNSFHTEHDRQSIGSQVA